MIATLSAMGGSGKKNHGRSSGRPAASSPSALRRMQAARQRDTAPELALRRELHRRGFRYRVDAQVIASVRRRADLLFPSLRVAVFVDGCFWHGCPVHGTWPKANAEFWRDKIETNKLRDADTDRRLAEARWKVVRFWEHEPLAAQVARLAQLLTRRRKVRTGA